MYKLLFSIPKIIGEKNRRKSTTKFNGSDIALTGTITSSGVSVTGSGTAFLTELEIGDWIVGTGLEFREVSAIISDTALTLSNAFTSDILIGQSFSRMQFFTERVDRIERHMKMIGEPFPVFANTTGAAIPDSKYFIELTKDLTGVGLYNENKLTGQASSVSGGQTYYTAIINDIESPMYGQVVPLLNSTVDNTSGLNVPTVISASESAGTFREHRMQGWQLGADADGSGAREYWGITGSRDNNFTSPGQTYSGITYINMSTSGQGDSKKVIAKSNGTHGTPNIGYTNEMNNISTTAYMRIK